MPQPDAAKLQQEREWDLRSIHPFAECETEAGLRIVALRGKDQHFVESTAPAADWREKIQRAQKPAPQEYYVPTVHFAVQFPPALQDQANEHFILNADGYATLPNASNKPHRIEELLLKAGFPLSEQDHHALVKSVIEPAGALFTQHNSFTQPSGPSR